MAKIYGTFGRIQVKDGEFSFLLNTTRTSFSQISWQVSENFLQKPDSFFHFQKYALRNRSMFRNFVKSQIWNRQLRIQNTVPALERKGQIRERVGTGQELGQDGAAHPLPAQAAAKPGQPPRQRLDLHTRKEQVFSLISPLFYCTFVKKKYFLIVINTEVR